MSTFHEIPSAVLQVSADVGFTWKEAGRLPQDPPAVLSTHPFSALTHSPEQVCVCLGVFTPRRVIAT